MKMLQISGGIVLDEKGDDFCVKYHRISSE